MPIGQIPVRANIIGVTNEKPCVITTEDPNLFVTGNFVRITDVNSGMPVFRGMCQLNNNRYRIEVVDDTHFKLFYPVTLKPVDSTLFVPYVTGGRVDLIAETFFFHGDE